LSDTLLWFGDSYTVGSELGHFYGDFEKDKYNDKIFYMDSIQIHKHRPDMAFPILVSKELELDYIVLGHSGASIQKLQFTLIDFLKQKFNSDKKYIAIFALPTQYSRCFYIDEKGLVISEPDDDILKHQIRFGKYEITMYINSIYTMCKTYNIEPYFLALWSKLDILENYNIVPDENWILPRSTTLVEKSWEFSDPPESWRNLFKIKPLERLKDNKFFKKYILHLLNVIILSQSNEVFKKYIFPCGNHPNKDGHKKLADTLIEILKEKLISD